MDKCEKCGMPLDEETTCGCDEKLCYHCCECPNDCACGCADRE